MSTNWETAEALKAPMEICWQFDYEIGIEKLRNLYSKSKQRQWDAEVDIDWSQPVDPSKPIIDEGQFMFDRLSVIKKLSPSKREEFTAHMSCHLLSQFLHGEQGAMMTAAALTHAVPDYEGKLYAATQTMDEARHVEVYERYINKLAVIYPISPWLKSLIDVTLQADHWVKIAIGMNMVVEGLALGAFHNMRRATTCELLRSITNNVLQDEARHVAFGNVYVGETIKEMDDDEREDIAGFAFEAVKLMSDSQGGARGDGQRAPDPGFLQMLATVGIEPKDFIASLMEAGASGLRAKMPPGQIHSFKDLMMPALVRVGAITDRTREMYAEAEIPVWEDASQLEALEDSETGVADLDRAEAY
ncbi:MAG: ferritin-like domain-containing protein [Deltaproteobacteria bacterium]|nr:ferritin-like domain-containing protein [Deltaproteobacteria bacterium]